MRNDIITSIEKQGYNDLEAAAYLGLPVSNLRKRRIENKGPKYRKIGACVRYLKTDLDEFLTSRPIGGDR